MAYDENKSLINWSVIAEFIKSMTENTTPLTLLLRSCFIMFIFALGLLWMKSDIIIDAWKTSQYEAVEQKIMERQSIDYLEAVKEQTKFAYSTIKPDMVAVFEYRPKMLNYYAGLSYYDGVLPSNMTVDDMSSLPINKDSSEYALTLSGLSYAGSNPLTLFETHKNIDIQYQFVCPIFNLENMYSGVVMFLWYERVPTIPNSKIEVSCNQARRVIGRIR